MVAMAMSLSDRVSLAGFGTTGSSISNLDILDMVPFWKRRRPGQTVVSLSEEGAEPCADLEDERLQDVSLDGGGQQEDGGLWVVLVPVDVDALTLQQLQAAFVWKHLNTPEPGSAPGPRVHHTSELKTHTQQPKKK